MNRDKGRCEALSAPLVLFILALGAGCSQPPDEAADPLPSWREGSRKQAIVDFVRDVTDSTGSLFVPVEERVAVFDNDGTLWSEQPVYFQLQFALDRVKTLAPEHPEWHRQQPFKAVLEGDIPRVAESGMPGLQAILGATHAGMTTGEFDETVTEWIRSARHPRFNRLYSECVFQPMLELMAYLRAHRFKTYIVSGGGIDFLRPWVHRVYGIPPEQVVGSSVVTRFEIKDGVPVLVRYPELAFFDDKDAKPVAIHMFIGRRPIAAFGNSDGDHQMLQWVAAGEGSRLMVLIHHTDADREWAYDRASHVGRLDKALDEAHERGWTVVDMMEDWRVIYPFEGNSEGGLSR